MENPFIKNLYNALAISPENLPLRKMLAEALLIDGATSEAEEEYKKILQLLPTDLDVKLGLAKAFFANSKFNESEIVADELLTANHFPALIYLLIAKISLKKGEAKKAHKFYNKAINIDAKLTDNDLITAIDDSILKQGLATQISTQDLNDNSDNFFSDLEKPQIKFADVGGMAMVKEEIALKIIHPMQNPQIYAAFGKKTGGGVLLYGPPGCGKTLLARATAGEIKANFISVGINDVLDMWIGNSEKNLHDIFQQARASTPCVLFFDEVDALGASRVDMRNTNGRFVINQFLDELDGVRYSNDGILILGATNTPWSLDPAFRRPGRFDRIIFVSPPDYEARVEVFNIHLNAVPTEGVNSSDLAKLTEAFSGADIKAVVDIAIESKLPQSLKLGKVIPVTQNDLNDAIKRHHSSTKEWFSTAKNHALYANQSGLYNDILNYLKIKI